MKNKRQRSEEIKKKLEDVLEWAKDGIADHSNPPWAFYNYMKLREAVEGTLKSLACVKYGSLSLEDVQREGLKLAVDNSKEDGMIEVPLPM